MNDVFNSIISLEIAGVILLIGSLFPMIKLMRELPVGSLKNQWKILFGLVLFFTAIYLFIAFHQRHADIFITGDVDTHREILCLLLFFGALFVFLVSTLSLKTALDIKRLSLLEMEINKCKLVEYALCKREERIASAQKIAKLGCWEHHLVNI